MKVITERPRRQSRTKDPLYDRKDPTVHQAPTNEGMDVELLHNWATTVKEFNTNDLIVFELKSRSTEVILVYNICRYFMQILHKFHRK